jgi:hypothetical protein
MLTSRHAIQLYFRVNWLTIVVMQQKIRFAARRNVSTTLNHYHDVVGFFPTRDGQGGQVSGPAAVKLSRPPAQLSSAQLSSAA